ncbi:hypothetical protein FI667_g7651, partial [Globisporangium splendens]
MMTRLEAGMRNLTRLAEAQAGDSDGHTVAAVLKAYVDCFLNRTDAIPLTPSDTRGVYLLFFDGGSRGNPGPGGTGSIIVRVHKDSHTASLIWAASMAYSRKDTTNNFAEYWGLIHGLREAQRSHFEPLYVIGDSALIISQQRMHRSPRQYRLARLYQTSRRLADCIDIQGWYHHYRAFNKMADSAANLAMDTRTSTQVHFPTHRAAFNNLTQDLDNDVMHWLMRSSEDPRSLENTRQPHIGQREHAILLPVVRYAAQTLEISTFVRGQKCVTATTDEDPETTILNCSTVFVDDYRYERALVLNDAEGWYTSTSSLRGAGQLFVWIRAVSLAIGCYTTRAAELKFHRAKRYTKLYYTGSALAKIPSHVIIYGNWLPIVCYAVAHFIDGALIHLINNTVWSTVNGTIDSQPVRYFTIASIQMRNIWLIALYLKLATVAHQKISRARTRRWTVQHGILGIRGMLFGLLSSLTVFGCLRAHRFRDSSVLAFHLLPRYQPLLSAELGFEVNNATEFGFRFDVKMLCVAMAVVTLAGLAVHVLFIMRGSSAKPKPIDTFVLSCHSYYVPHSAKTLWPEGSALVYWRMRLILPDALRAGGSNSVTPAPHPMQHPIADPERARDEASLGSVVSMPPQCLYCGYSRREKRLQKARWHIIQGCPARNNLIDMDTRSRAHWSAVRLENIAMLTDPVVLLKLFVIGHQFFIYRSTFIRESRRTLLPPLALGDVDLRPPAPARGINEDECLPQMDAIEVDDETVPRSRLYLVPYKLRDAFTSFTPIPECIDKELFLMRYELIAMTHSGSLPWTLLVNCG